MSEHVISRCQLLSVLVERGPGSPDSISDFGRLLLLESNRLAQIFCALSFCPCFDCNVINLNLFSDVQALVIENFRLSWMDPESHVFSTSLEFVLNVFGAVLLRMQIGARRQRMSCL